MNASNNQTRFGKILQHDTFQRFVQGLLSPVIWQRQRGSWAIPIKELGNGRSGWPVNRKEVVIKIGGAE